MQRALHPSGTPVSMTSSAGCSHWTTRDDGGREVDRPSHDQTRKTMDSSSLAPSECIPGGNNVDILGPSTLRLGGPSPALFPPL